MSNTSGIVLKKERSDFANILSITCIGLASVYLGLFLYLNIAFVYINASIFITLFIINQVFIKRKFEFLYKVLIPLVILHGITTVCLTLGKESGMYFCFAAGGMFPLIIFNHKETKVALSIVLLYVAFFIFFLFDPIVKFQNLVDPDIKENINIIAPWTILLFMGIPVYKLYQLFLILIKTVLEEKEIIQNSAKLNQSQAELLESIINSSKYDSIFAVDNNLNLLKFNKAFLRWMRQTQDKSPKEGDNYLDLLPKPKALLYKPLFRRALKGKTFSKKIINNSLGEEVHLEMTFTPLEHENDIVGVSVFIRDVSDTAKLEYTIQEKRITEKSLQFRTDFLAQMSHEIRTPLNGIVGMADLINDSDNLSEKEKDQLKIITDSGNELMHIINSVLDLSKLEAGQVKISNAVRETNKLLNHSVDLFEAKSQIKNIQLKTEYQAGLPSGVKVDAVRIHQILNNFTSNAIKFTNEGSVTLRLKHSSAEEGKINLRFEVEDTGNGIREADKKRLFNKYQQLSTNVARKADGTNMGTGLGLTICHELVQLMNGEIGVESKIGKGSLFYFELKNLSIEKVNEGSNPIKNDEVFKGIGKHILIVEDKKVNQKVAQMVLKSIGCTSEVADNGEEGLMTYMKTPEKFDLILMDIQMPIMDGLTATAELKRNFQNLPPIIALSANNMEGDEDNFTKFGLDGYISKPINTKILKEKLSIYFK